MLNASNAAYLFAILTFIVVCFQLALALGAPWGSLAMGGKYPGRFPRKMRIAALFQIVILIFVAWIVMDRAGLVRDGDAMFTHKLIWGVVVFTAIGTILNLISPSKWERSLWAPVTIVLFITSYIVATGQA